MRRIPRLPSPKPDDPPAGVRRRKRRGAAIIVILSLLPLIGFTALVVDIGMLQVERTQLQGAVDAAALAGVGYLDGTNMGMYRAVQKTHEFAAANDVMGVPVQLHFGDVYTGYYDAEEDRFVSSYDPAKVNAIYVKKEVTGIGTFFANVAFGVGMMSMNAKSIAKAGTRYPAGETPCFLPLAVPDCYLDNPEYEFMPLRMSSAQDDNTGWSNPNGTVDDTYVANQFQGQCDYSEAVVGDQVTLQNGQMNSAYQVIDTMLENSTEPWDETKWGALPPQMGSAEDPEAIPGTKYSQSSVTNYGYVIQGPMVVFSSPTGECGSEMQFNQTAPITGFVWAVVYDVDNKSYEKNIRVRLDLTYEYDYGTAPGGEPGANVIFQDDHQLVY